MPIITKEKFNEHQKEKIELKGECESCSCEVDLYETIEFPACDNPENMKYFKGYCSKCDCYYQIKKTALFRKMK
jgi:hypothetical protein